MRCQRKGLEQQRQVAARLQHLAGDDRLGDGSEAGRLRGTDDQNSDQNMACAQHQLDPGMAEHIHEEHQLDPGAESQA